MEIASCLDFLWKKQAKKELKDMTEMRGHTNQLGELKFNLFEILKVTLFKYQLLKSEIFEIFAFRNDFHSFVD